MDVPQRKKQPRTFHAVLVIVLLACLITGTVLVWRTLLEAEAQRNHQLLQQETSSLVQQMEIHFNYQTDALQRLADRWQHYQGQPLLWQHDVDNLLHDFLNLQAIEWLDEHYQVRWIRPLEGNEQALGFQYPPDHPNRASLKAARESGQAVLSNHFELVQGGHGLAYQIPIFRPESGGAQLEGYLVAIFRVEQLLDSLLKQLPVGHMSLALGTGEQTLFQRERADVSDTLAPIRVGMRLGGNDNFFIESQPTRSSHQNSPIPLIALISGLLGSLLLCHALWLALLNAQRLTALQFTNRLLQGEIARRHEVEQVLQTSQSRLQLVLDMTDYSYDALFILTLDPLEIVYMNRTCWASIGYDEEQLRNIVRISPDDLMLGATGWLQSLRQQVERGESTIYQQQVRARSGELLPLEISVRPMSRLGCNYLVCVGRNNHEQLEATAQLQKLSQLDGLTGVFNRRFFDSALASEWRRLQRQHLPLGLLMIDVDFFKRYNDTFGHLAGDDALRQISRALQQHVGREGERVCRYGGEEFAVLLPGADLAQCNKVAALIHEEVRRMNIPHVTEPDRRLTVSIGIACALPGCSKPAEALVRAADAALYEAKGTGRNRSAGAELVA